MSDLDDELAALRAEYAAALPGKVAAIAALVDAAASGASGAVEELRLKAHRLRGSAGSYGFGQVSEDAGRLEDAVKAALAEGRPPADAVLRECLLALQRAAG